MIVKAFEAADAAGRLRWAAAGGVALAALPAVVHPHRLGTRERVPGGAATGWDRAVLAQFATALRIKRTRLHDAGCAGQRLELVGWPFRRSVWSSAAGVPVERMPGWAERHRLRAAGYLWQRLTGFRPAALHVESAPWIVPPKTMWNSGDRTYHILFEAGRESGVRCRLRHTARSGSGVLSPRMARVAFSVFERVPGLVGWRSPCGGAVAFRRRDDAEVAFGLAVQAGLADVPAQLAWVCRDPQTVAGSLTAEDFGDRYRRAFHRPCPPAVFLAAGY